MKKEQRIMLIIGAVFVIFAACFVVIKGSAYTLKLDTVSAPSDLDKCEVTFEQVRETVKLTDKRVVDGVLTLDIRSVSPGRAYINVCIDGEYAYTNDITVHRFGTITVGGFLGSSSGDFIIPILISVYIVMMIAYVVIQYRRDMRRSLYQYKNIRHLGWIIFLSLALLPQLFYIFSDNSLAKSVKNILSSASIVACLVFPVAFIVSILISASNIQLIRREGRNWKNMLGLMLGALLCVSTVFPLLLSEFLQRTTLVDVHNEQGAALYVEMAVTNLILVTVSYLECILWGTVILSVKAAKRVPAFDKDYILILGCQIRKDGSLTPLLKGRADRAVEFAKMQKEATGKKLKFVPSGGQGSDECMAEAAAVKNYLISAGIPEDKILAEDKSTSTIENFAYSLELIKKDKPGEDVKTAFSTTNYHVFRSGVVSEEQGCRSEGIGSRTKAYYWINAFIREFVATVHSEWKNHLRVTGILALWVLALVMVVRMSNIV